MERQGDAPSNDSMQKLGSGIVATDPDMPCEENKENMMEFNLSNIHQRIDCTLRQLQSQHQHVDDVLGDIKYLKTLSIEVLMVVNDLYQYPRIKSLKELKNIRDRTTHDISSGDPGVDNRRKGLDSLGVLNRLNDFITKMDKYIAVLQEMYMGFTQKVLVPLQTFCSGHQPYIGREDVSLQRIESEILDLMSKIKVLLWSPEVEDYYFSNELFSQTVADEVDCTTCPLLRLIPDVLQKLNAVFTRAQTWLRRDILYVQNTKAALHRASKKCVQMKRRYDLAKEAFAQLQREATETEKSIRSHEERLAHIKEEIQRFRKEREKVRESKTQLEEKLQDSSNLIDVSLDVLKVRVKALRKRLLVLGTKIESRERTYGHIKEKLKALKIEHKIIQDRIKNSEKYLEEMEEKLKALLKTKHAWEQRHAFKTDPEHLRAKQEAKTVRIPLKAVRVKTFVTKTRQQTLQRALALVEEIYDGKQWKRLATRLTWPDGAHITAEDMAAIQARCPDDIPAQAQKMLMLWRARCGKMASTESLMLALKSSDQTDVAERIEKLLDQQ
ncbi:PREDICTED: uncharacterized protein LOC109474563 isoform X1 [Branchiostoma belcheri]|uniref:Uncharacterized protein LOC109474563 isoform X1 n=2 Tax=Branchiostoma belcheri TaxID=7741 RepID=A0A6P4Z1N5_BRABE|nr:PREDICTED: uncharacterized protein LOC109474563 isoform X1 [Branchiostoma belcheri]